MKDFKDKRSKEINDIISTVKIISLMFCGIIVCSKSYNNKNEVVYSLNGSFFWGMILMTGIIALIYWFWSFYVFFTVKTKYKKAIQIADNIMFIIIFTILIIASNSYSSEYKFMYLFIIIASTIELGMRFGIAISFVSSVILSIIDLVFAPKSSVNIYFQNDLVIIVVFMITAWALGYYVKVEADSSKEKDIKLEELNYELENQNQVRKYIEEMLIKNQKCYDLLIKNSPNAIYVHLDGKLIFVNEYAVKLLGFLTQEEILGKSLYDISPIEDKVYLEEKMWEIYSGKEVKPFEIRVMKSDGETICIENTSTSFIYNKKVAILSIFRDITYEKQVEKLQNDVEKKAQLLKESREINELIIENFSNISHELKTPLNVIFSAIQVLIYCNDNNYEGVNVDKGKYLGMIKQNCYRLTRLINNLLDMTRADSGFLKLQLQNYNIVNVIEEIVLSVAPYIESKGMVLTFDTNVEERIMAIDPDKIERIILNLLSNAIKFSDAGGEIFVLITDKGDSIDISVKDTGVGIPEDKINLIFERFGQVDRTLRRNSEGSGIGLSIVKTFVEMQGGSIRINSKVNQGSEFIISFPIKIEEKKYLEEDYLYETNIERICIEFSDIYSDIN